MWWTINLEIAAGIVFGTYLISKNLSCCRTPDLRYRHRAADSALSGFSKVLPAIQTLSSSLPSFDCWLQNIRLVHIPLSSNKKVSHENSKHFLKSIYIFWEISFSIQKQQKTLNEKAKWISARVPRALNKVGKTDSSAKSTRRNILSMTGCETPILHISSPQPKDQMKFFPLHPVLTWA